eukprot:gene27308-36052_t
MSDIVGIKRSFSETESNGKEPAYFPLIEEPERNELEYISLTTHREQFGSNPIPLLWGESDPNHRGPVVATVKHGGQRNAIGAHGGGYCIYTALAVAAGELDPNHIPNLNKTAPTDDFGPFPQWKDPKKIVTIDPWGHLVTDVFSNYLTKACLLPCPHTSIGLTIYMWGDPKTIPDESIPLTVRVHDECNGSDVFGSDICTCRPYLAHAIDECGCGVVVYFRKEGRSLGEVTKVEIKHLSTLTALGMLPALPTRDFRP